MLMYNFPVIYQNITVRCSNQNHLHGCSQYLESRVGEKLASLFKTNKQGVLVELITMLEFSPAKVLQALSDCAMADDTFQQQEKESGRMSSAVLAEYVGGSLPAVLASFITSCSHRELKAEKKLQCLKSLELLMTILKFENLKSCKYALMDCIKLATNLSKTNDQFEEISTKLWMTFIKTFDKSALVGLLPQILCKILPHLKSSPAQTLEMFRYLLEDNVEEVKEQHYQLMFLRRIPELEEVLSSVGGRELGLRETLQGLILCLDSESVDVRLQTLKTLSIVLNDNIGGVQGLVVCSDRTDPLVQRLVTSLMKAISSREPDSEVRSLSGLCLGRLGPLDPGRLEVFVSEEGAEDEEKDRNRLLDVFSAEFCVELLQELVRAQASAREPIIAENCSYSIQEVLRINKINLQSKNPEDFSYRVWRRLSDVTQEKLTPLLTSHYMHSPSTSRPPLTSPVYLSQHGRTYRDWLLNWTMALVSLISNSKKRELFEVCLVALKRDLTIGDLLLPRIVIEVLCDCNTTSTEMLRTEIKFIIESINIQDPEEKDLQHSVAATLFLVQDHIRLWMRTKFSSLLSSTRKTESQLKPDDIKTAVAKSKEYVSVSSFVKEISNEDLANFCYDVSNSVTRCKLFT